MPKFTPKTVPSPSTITAPSNTPTSQPTPLTTPISIRIQSVVLPQYAFQIHIHTDQQLGEATGLFQKCLCSIVLIVSDALIITATNVVNNATLLHTRCISGSCVLINFGKIISRINGKNIVNTCNICCVHKTHLTLQSLWDYSTYATRPIQYWLSLSHCIFASAVVYYQCWASYS